MRNIVETLIENNIGSDSVRFESKHTFKARDHWRLMEWIATSPLGFREVYTPRKINSIYLDSWDFKNFSANLNGESVRAKPRLRWYGSICDTQTPLNFELKCKKSQTGYKLTIPFTRQDYNEMLVNGFANSDEFVLMMLSSLKMSDAISSYVSTQTPNVFVHYDRTYYESICGDFRLTIDEKISYKKYNKASNLIFDELNVCELKSKVTNDNRLLWSDDSFPFRATKNSKYCAAVYNLYYSAMAPNNWDIYQR